MMDVHGFAKLGMALEQAETATKAAEAAMRAESGEAFGKMKGRTKVVIDHANFASGDGYLQAAINEILPGYLDMLFNDAFTHIEKKEREAREAIEAALKQTKKKAAA